MKLAHTLTVCTCLLVAGMSFSNATPTPAPQQNAGPQQRVQKWEYKLIGIYNTEGGAQAAEIGVKWGDANEPWRAKPLAKTVMSQMGEEGWELVGQSVFRTQRVGVFTPHDTLLTFRRP